MILQILPSLRGGGAERMAINLANEWALRGYDVEFALMEKAGVFLTAVSPGVHIHDLKAVRFREVPRLLSAYFRERQPEITLVHMWPLTSAAILAWRLAGSPGRLFVCEHTCLSEHVSRDLSTPLAAVKASLRLTHSRATGVVAVSQGAASDLARLMGLPDCSIQVIHNPVVPADLQPRISTDPAERQRLWQGNFSRTFITIGSLIKSKNLMLLLDAFSDLAEDFNAGLVILGEGPEHQALEQRIQELGLQERVRLPGFDPNPDPWLRSADLFVLSSDFEGLSNVIIEALAAGTPVVSTACPHGPDEILDRGRYGVLVPVGDRAALSLGIRAALNRSWNPEDLQRRSLDFSIPTQASAYFELFGSSK